MIKNAENNSNEYIPHTPRLLNTNNDSENIPNESNIDAEPEKKLDQFKNQDALLVNSQDILEMDIIFDNNTDAENQMDNSSSIIKSNLHKEADSKNLSNGIVDMEIDFDCGKTTNEVDAENSCDIECRDSECTDTQVISHDNVTTMATNDQDCEDIISEDRVKKDLSYDEQNVTNNIDFEGHLSSLVVVAREDPLDANNVIHEVFLMSQDTGIMSDEPLDLPSDIIERIKASLLEGSLQ